MVRADPLIADLKDLGGAGLSVTEFGRPGSPSPVGAGAVRLGVHRSGPPPRHGLEAFDILLSADPAAARPWVGVTASALDPLIDDLRDRVTAQPAAAAAAAQVLRMTLDLEFEQALLLESMAYSMLLASAGFRTWRAERPVRTRSADVTPRVRVDQTGPRVEITLDRPDARNAFDARMRDELVEALSFALEHPDAPGVTLRGEGPAFSAGGDLDEFGSTADVGLAHMVRTLRSPARLVHALGDRITANLHGACVGAGIEVPAAAAQVQAKPGAVFFLPEVTMGLIPGAGGTVTIPRRIGRHRACFMTISGAAVDLPTALGWGLVDAETP